MAAAIQRHSRALPIDSFLGGAGERRRRLIATLELSAASVPARAVPEEAGGAVGATGPTARRQANAGVGRGSKAVARVHYRIVAHDGGWAYKLNDVFSEPFPTKSVALAAAKRVALEQHIPGDTTHIEYQDETGAWHSELSEGDDRPDADVVA